jgi:bifunctional polynucleotide phosphatase/kinase
MSFFAFPAPELKRPFSGKLVVFDVDSTLVVSKSGRRWASDADDWIWSSSGVPEMLNKYYTNDWIVAFVTNQSEWKSHPEIKEKLASILDKIEEAYGWKPYCLVATASRKEKDIVYRKPARGLFDKLLEILKIGEKDITSLQMCGDASGETDKNPAYRWSDSDRMFAKGIGATFLRPNEVFNAREVEHVMTREIVVLMGNPGSGKSTTAQSLVKKGYVHFEQDSIGSKEKVFKAVKEFLAGADSSSLVIDATHSSLKNREMYYELAKKYKLPIRILWHVKDGRPFNELREKPVPEVAYAIYSKHFTDPREDDVVVEIL